MKEQYYIEFCDGHFLNLKSKKTKSLSEAKLFSSLDDCNNFINSTKKFKDEIFIIKKKNGII